MKHAWDYNTKRYEWLITYNNNSDSIVLLTLLWKRWHCQSRTIVWLLQTSYYSSCTYSQSTATIADFSEVLSCRLEHDFTMMTMFRQPFLGVFFLLLCQSVTAQESEYLAWKQWRYFTRSSPQWWSSCSTTVVIVSVSICVAHLGLWRKLYVYCITLYHFTTSQCIQFSSTWNLKKGNFRSRFGGLWVRGDRGWAHSIACL